MNQYRLTFRDKEEKVFECDAEAVTMRLALQENHTKGELLKIERIDPWTGAVLGGLYNE